ncbi:MAG: plasmid encoded RepA protein, partial [Hymenobacter sp.]
MIVRDNATRSTSKERQQRMVSSSEITSLEDPRSLLFQHTVLCQAGLPYRDPGEEVTRWQRINGNVHLSISAGVAMDPEKGLVQIGLPFGPKARLILAHLNGEALRAQSPEIEVEASLTAFVKRLKLDSGGRTINTIKDQLTRLSTANITLGTVRDGRAVTINSQIVTAFDLWFSKDGCQKFLWPSTLRLSTDYFESLKQHAVPLHDRALMALSGNAMALDIYAWLAQRLHRAVNLLKG